jgi:hypothetical protein
MMQIEKYSMGVGDRFARQGKAQLQAMIQAADAGVSVAPVWNKSHREHQIIHTCPDSVRAEADAAVADLNWTGPYHVDADHIGLDTVDAFLAASDFFTLDVADFTGQGAPDDAIDAFVAKHEAFVGQLDIEGIDEAFTITRDDILACARKYLLAVRKAGEIYRHIESAKGAGQFITEVSMDETDQPQTPLEMLFILAAIADESIPAQTIAPKFTGRFNKGVDYVGDVDQFAREFNADLAVINYATKHFDLPTNLKLSVHSGSDKFSIYGPIHQALKRFDAGLHIKTAGTTWLEELIGLAVAGEDGLAIAKEVYRNAYGRFDELAKPYATVIDIDSDKLPEPDEVDAWRGEQYAEALRHDPDSLGYNPHFRQLLHVGYKVAAEMGERYLHALEANEAAIAPHVTGNIFDRHLKPVFLGG